MDTLGRLLLLATLFLTPAEAQQGRTRVWSPRWVGVRNWGRGSSASHFPLGETKARQEEEVKRALVGTSALQ
jgi:hypothetical protein